MRQGGKEAWPQQVPIAGSMVGSVPLGAPVRQQRTLLRVISPEVRAVGAFIHQPHPQLVRAPGNYSSPYFRPALEEGSQIYPLRTAHPEHAQEGPRQALSLTGLGRPGDGAHLSATRPPPAPGWWDLELSDRRWVSVAPS